MWGVFGSVVGSVLLLWVAFFACLKFLDAQFGGRVGEWLARAGVDLRPGYVRWYSRALNPWFTRMGRNYPTFLRQWYALGAVFGFAAMVCSVLLLALNLYWTLKQPDQPAVLTPVVPGVNVPSSHLAYYMIALAVAGVIHEIGHALAATSENMQVNGFGAFLVVLYPGAFVDLPEDSLQHLSPGKLLKIYCAGAWHNIALSVACVLLIWTLPFLLSPLYSTGHGVLITHVPEDSPFFGHVEDGHRVVAIGECRVNGLYDWADCLNRWSASLMYPDKATGLNSGFCLSDSLASRLIRTHGTACCGNDDHSDGGVEPTPDADDGRSSNEMCFTLGDPTGTSSSPAAAARQLCSIPRQMATNAFCSEDERCQSETSGFVCARPVTEEHHAVIKLTLHDSSFLLFYGHPHALWYSLMVSDYVPRSPMLPTSFPSMVEKTLRYTASLSGGLAVINMAPIQWLDGQWAATAILSLFFPSLAPRTRDLILRVLSTGTAALFVGNVLTSVGLMFF